MTLCWNRNTAVTVSSFQIPWPWCQREGFGQVWKMWNVGEITILTFFIFLFFPTPILLSFLSFSSLSFCLYLRRWGWGWRGRRTSAVLFWLCHALPDCVLEGSVRLRPAHGILERVGVFHCFYSDHRSFDGCDWWPGQSLRLHHWPEGLSHRCGVCSPGNIRPWWVCEFFLIAHMIHCCYKYSVKEVISYTLPLKCVGSVKWKVFKEIL